MERDSTAPDLRDLESAIAAARDLITFRSERAILGICGAPGSGKTTVAKALAAGVCAVCGDGVAVHVPMDGFHLANATLQRLGLRERKGARETFDADGFIHLVDRLRVQTKSTVYAPEYSRELHEPVAGSIAVATACRLVIVEGNYLLDPATPWRRFGDLASAVWFCDTPDAVRRERLIARHVAGGRDLAGAEDWVARVDSPNAEAILANAGSATRRIAGTIIA